MFQGIQKKFFTTHDANAFALPNDHMLLKQYNKHWQEESNPINFLCCTSFVLVGLIGNLHNQIMASNQNKYMKFTKVAVLSTLSTTAVTLFTVAETIIRFIPGILGYLTLRFSVDEKSAIEDRKKSISENLASFFLTGAYMSSLTIKTCFTMGSHMLTKDQLYNLDETFPEMGDKAPSNPKPPQK